MLKGTASHEKGVRNEPILEPPPTAPSVTPDLLLVPLLAFDKEGHRLGYGQGYFDRYLHRHKAITVGIGFKGQEVEKIPHQVHDFALDYILTEDGFRKNNNKIFPKLSR